MTTETNNELACRFVSSRGILRSTKTHLANPISGTRKIPWELAVRLNSKVETLYLTVEMLPRFVKYHLWRIRKPFTLVTGDSIRSIDPKQLDPTILEQLLQNKYLKKWFAQNLNFSHPKLEPIPLGVDYHTLASKADAYGKHRWGKASSAETQELTLKQICKAAGSIRSKHPKAFSNWHFAADRGNRQECLKEIDHSAAYFQETFMVRKESWKLNSNYAFTLSPLGAGLDCHRTWEALLLGSIPIVKTSPIDPLYEDLPVLILESWSELTPQRLEHELQQFESKCFDFSKLELSTWVKKINQPGNHKPNFLTWDKFLASL